MFVPNLGPDRSNNPLGGFPSPAGPLPLGMPGALDRIGAPTGNEALLPMLQMQQQSAAMLMQMMQILMTLMQNQGLLPNTQLPSPIPDSSASQTAPVGNSGNAQSSSSALDATSGPVQGSELGKRLAQRAEANAKAVNTPGWCLREVGKVLREFDLPIDRHPSAYMALNDFRKSNRFQEIKVSKEQIKSLPAGAIVIWDKGPGLPHGHISIALGDGREASSTVRNQLTLSTQFWVFLPK